MAQKKETIKDNLENYLEPEEKKLSEEELLQEDDVLEDTSVGEVKLHCPVKMDDEEIGTFAYDFKAVKPIQYINLIKRISKKRPISVPELDYDVQIGYFAMASCIPVSVIKGLQDTRDLTKIQSLVRDFLLG